MAKRNPRARIAEKVAPLVVELGKLGFNVEAKLNTDNEGEVKWKKKPPTKESTALEKER